MGLGALGGLLGILSVLFGMAECFFGYRIFKIVMGITGFAIGAVLLGGLGSYLSDGNKLVVIVMGLVGGAAGAALLVALYILGVFLIGAVLGTVLGLMIFGLFQHDPIPVVLVILAVVGGILAVSVQKFMIIFSTAFSGAWAMVAGMSGALFHGLPGSYSSAGLLEALTGLVSRNALLVIFWLGLGIAGMVVQYRNTPKVKRSAPKPVPPPPPPIPMN